MCGIAGILRLDGKHPEVDCLNRLSSRIAHRGLDDVGSFINGPIALAHRRLSILDLSSAGHQPMQAADGSTFAYNGEVYNFRDLRSRLAAQGITVHSTGDTEVLLKACQAWGVLEAAKQFNGMFAFAYWDEPNRKLWLVRDRTGIKPLYYHRDSHSVIFASEIKALLGEIKPELDEGSLLTLLMAGPMQEPQTLFRDIQAVEAGSSICFSAEGQKTTLRFVALEDLIDATLYQELDGKSDKQIIEIFGELVSNSVRLHLASDVKLATMVSGGLDSNLVSCAANQFQSGICAYHADVVGPLSELRYAQSLVAHTSQPLRVVHCTADDFLKQMVHVTYLNECPISQHPNTVPFYLVCRLAAADGTKVMLTGEGADELFGGYPMFRSLMRRRRMDWFRETVTLALNRVGLDRIGRSARWLMDADSHWGFNSRAFSVVTHGRWLERIDQAREAYAFIKDPMEREFQSDLFGYLHSYLQSILWRNDRMGMAVGLESRVPYLENELIRHALNLPLRFKWRGGMNKWVLRQVAAKQMPKMLSWRAKRGFPVATADLPIATSNFFSDGFLENTFRMGRKQRESLQRSFPELRFPLLATECWGRLFFMGEDTETVTQSMIRNAH